MAKNQFLTGKKIKNAKNVISRKIGFIWFHEFFCLDFFKFSGPLWIFWSINLAISIKKNYRGKTADVGWSMDANHGGGYSYRLCKINNGERSELTEECFQRHSEPEKLEKSRQKN